MRTSCCYSAVAAALVLILSPLAASAQSPVKETRSVETEFIWTQSEAETKCPRVAAEAGGQWTGDWRMSVPGKTSICQVSLTPQLAPRTRNIEVGPIWSQSEAEAKCPRAAADARGQWTGQWKTTVPGQMSVCEIADRPAPKPQNVEAGPIWSQADAALKCPVAAAAVRGTWTGQWFTTVQGQMSVCEMTNMPSPELRKVEAGPIWNQADADIKCPVVADAVRGKWTGQWSTSKQGQMSVCEIAG